MAWLKETGRKRREMLPLTTEKQKSALSAAIFRNCFRDCIVWTVNGQRTIEGKARSEGEEAESVVWRC
jgi:hypothetical protein